MAKQSSKTPAKKSASPKPASKPKAAAKPPAKTAKPAGAGSKSAPSSKSLVKKATAAATTMAGKLLKAAGRATVKELDSMVEGSGQDRTKNTQKK